MTRSQYKKTIRQQLRDLNERIDYKILNGMRYVEDSRRHKELRRKMQMKGGLLQKLFPSITQYIWKTTNSKFS